MTLCVCVCVCVCTCAFLHVRVCIRVRERKKEKKRGQIHPCLGLLNVGDNDATISFYTSICGCVNLCVCTRACVCVCGEGNMRVCACASMRAYCMCVCERVCTCMCVCVCTCVYVCVCVSHLHTRTQDTYILTNGVEARCRMEKGLMKVKEALKIFRIHFALLWLHCTKWNLVCCTYRSLYIYIYIS